MRILKEIIIEAIRLKTLRAIELVVKEVEAKLRILIEEDI